MISIYLNGRDAPKEEKVKEITNGIINMIKMIKEKKITEFQTIEFKEQIGRRKVQIKMTHNKEKEKKNKESEDEEIKIIVKSRKRSQFKRRI